MPASTLPPAASVSVSAEMRLAYVLHHFRLAYPGSPAVTIGYAGAQPQVEIREASGGFFSKNTPYPPAPNRRAWLGQSAPFFFDSAPDQPLLTYVKNSVFIAADIISAAFYLLSGWQEYFSAERDRHGRFPYAASVQQKYNFVALPVVNYYFDVLKTAVEYVSGQPLQPRRWGSQQAEFAAFISHDVDNLHSAWKAPAKAALKQQKFGLFGKLLWQHLTRPDAWDNLEAVAAATRQYGARSTFFILSTHRKSAAGTPNADYRITQRLRQRLGRLAEQSCEIGVHVPLTGSPKILPGIWAFDMLFNEVGCRFHYLYWEPRITPYVVEMNPVAAAAKFKYDSTLGFAEHFGFRNSYCLPFFLFDFEFGQKFNFLEIPLNVMDATLHHPTYLHLKPAEILPALLPVFAEIRKFGGVASILWHNENFDPANTQNGPQQFHELLAHLQQLGAGFFVGREIWREFTPEPGDPIFNS